MSNTIARALAMGEVSGKGCTLSAAQCRQVVLLLNIARGTSALIGGKQGVALDAAIDSFFEEVEPVQSTLSENIFASFPGEPGYVAP